MPNSTEYMKQYYEEHKEEYSQRSKQYYLKKKLSKTLDELKLLPVEHRNFVIQKLEEYNVEEKQKNVKQKLEQITNTLTAEEKEALKKLLM